MHPTGENNTAPTVVAPGVYSVDKSGSNPKESWAEKLRAFPGELKTKRIWSVWRNVKRSKDSIKVPLALMGRKIADLARSNDPATWVSFDNACAVADEDPDLGLGLFTDGTFTFLDCDHCHDPATGETSPWAQEILDRLNSYAEYGPGLTGIHCFTLGPVSAAIKKNSTELCSELRFIPVTGQRVPSAPEVLKSADVEAIRQDIGSGKLGAPEEGVSAEKTSLPIVDQTREQWRSLFHSYEEIVNAPPLRFAVEQFLQEDGITFFGGLAGHGKTLLMLNVAKSLLEGGCLFGYEGFRVSRKSNRVLYLVPESGLAPFTHRLKLFRLLDHIKQERMFVRTLSVQEPLESLDDPLLKVAVEGADVFLDTAIRFMTGDENSSSDNREFAKMLFSLQSAGARTIVGAHHSPKAFGKRVPITLENALRGSGDVGAMLSTAWAIKQVNPLTNRLYIQNVKARDFDPCEPFELEGRPHIDNTGSLRMVKPREAAAAFRPQKRQEQIARAKQLKVEGWTDERIGKEVGVSERTIRRWREKEALNVSAGQEKR